MFGLDLNGLTGEVVTRKNAEYKEARQEWNRAIQKFPLVIVYASSVQDVSNAVRWAVKHRIDLRIRSGSHHYEGYSTGNHVLVLDVSRLSSIKLDATANTLTAGGGVKNEQIYEFAGKRGYPFPGGTCPTVGVSGYVLGGGWGYSSRYFGLGCDSLIGLELINAEGDLIKASKRENKDLFWACKGAGGGNFGVVVSMTFRLPPKIRTVTLVHLYRPDASPEIIEQFLLTWQKWLPRADRKITISTTLYDSAAEGMAIFGRGFYYGAADEAKRILSPFAKISGMELSAEEKPFSEAVREVEKSYPSSEKFKSTGRFVFKTYTPDEIRTLVELIQNKPPGSIFAGLTVYALGGKVQEVKPNEKAFYYRNARYIAGIQSVWEEDRYASVNQRWVVQRFRILASLTEGSFVNFPISELPNYETAYYGANAERLREVNDRYDPSRVFQFPQAIR